ncbi:MAG TPA: alpha/beta hydrolase [Actinomycetota bacterium]|nr:alpha/beta hydrolase [Actinomycetota bacterium]
MPEVRNGDVTLHVEVDGSGEPVTVLAHGLTNSCRELAPFTPSLAGTAARFCFRGHGHSSSPDSGYGFADLASDLDVIARAYGASNAIGTSMGAGAIMRLLQDDPDRFEKIVMLLPASLDVPFEHPERFDGIADLLETYPKDEAIERILAMNGDRYERAPWLRELDLLLWADMNPAGVARAIREVTRDVSISDRELLRKVESPVLLICREGDVIHPAELGRVLDDLFPNSQLITIASEEELIASIPLLIDRVKTFLADP